MLKQATDFLWTVIALLYQLVLVTVLIALLMGDGAGGSIASRKQGHCSRVRGFVPRR